MGVCCGCGPNASDYETLATQIHLLPKPTVPKWLKELCEQSEQYGALEPKGPVVATWALVFKLNNPTLDYCAWRVLLPPICSRRSWRRSRNCNPADFSLLTLMSVLLHR